MACAQVRLGAGARHDVPLPPVARRRAAALAAREVGGGVDREGPGRGLREEARGSQDAESPAAARARVKIGGPNVALRIERVGSCCGVLLEIWSHGQVPCCGERETPHPGGHPATR